MKSPLKIQSLPELIHDAHDMLLDRSPQEAKLIYAIACLDNEARAAIILAYQNIYKDEKP